MTYTRQPKPRKGVKRSLVKRRGINLETLGMTSQPSRSRYHCYAMNMYDTVTASGELNPIVNQLTRQMRYACDGMVTS